jgi:hypothetical protein
MSTRRIRSEDNPQPKPHPDAIKFLVVEAMQHAQTMKLIFDADESCDRKMFRLSKEEYRDVFRRTTVVERLHQKYRSQIKGMISKGSAA